MGRSQLLYEFGNPNTATYGQTFVAPTDSYLKSYTSSFAYSGGDAFDFRLYVGEWDSVQNRLADAPLFTSGDLNSVAEGDGFQAIKVNTNLSLTAGKKYVAFYSTSAQSSRPFGLMQQALANSNAYADGDFAFQNNGDDFGSLSNNGWNVGFTPNDTAFRAEFQAVPEPASMLALGASALGLLRRRRAKA